MEHAVPVVKLEPGLSGDEEGGGETLFSPANVKMEITFPQLPIEFEARNDAEGSSQCTGCIKKEKDVAITQLFTIKAEVDGRSPGGSGGGDIEISVLDIKQECLAYSRKPDQRTGNSPAFFEEHCKRTTNLAALHLSAVEPEPGSPAGGGATCADVRAAHSDIKVESGEYCSSRADRQPGFLRLQDPVLANPTLPPSIAKKEPEMKSISNAKKMTKSHNLAEIKKISCSQCSYTCKRERDLSKHIMLTHIGMNPYPCLRCTNTFSEKSNLRRHMLTHTVEKPFSCSECTYTSARKYKLKTHMLTHTGEKPFLCLLCTFSCNQKDNLKSHMLTHTGDKPFSCSKCAYTAKRKSNLRMHLVSHAEDKLYSCSECAYTCNQKAYLNIHMNSHTGEKLFSCSQCSYSSIYKGHLMRHKLTHTGDKPFSCSQCAYTCNRKSNLRNHMLTHTGKKPFSCSQCTYTCNWKASLTSHMASHTGEKLFSCLQCTYTCNTKSSLKRHTLTHSAEKPFSCTECEYKCAMKGILRSHVNKQHPRSS